MQTFHSRRCNICSFCLLKRMPTKNLLHHLRWFFRRFLQKIYQRVTVWSVQSVGILSTWYRNLSNFLTEFNSRLAVDLYHFINTTQCWLSLTCHEMCPDSEAINFVTLKEIYIYITSFVVTFHDSQIYSHLYLLVQAYYSLLVDVVWSTNHQFCEPRYVVLGSNFLKDISRYVTEIRQITAVNPNPNGSVFQVIQS